MLRLACALADGVKHAVALGKELQNLNENDITLVLNAVAHAAGWHTSGHTAHITGSFDK